MSRSVWPRRSKVTGPAVNHDHVPLAGNDVGRVLAEELVTPWSGSVGWQVAVGVDTKPAPPHEESNSDVSHKTTA